MRIHDISVVLHENLVVWPGDEPIELVSTAAIAAGDAVNMHRLALGTHTGTHIDAPRHFLDDGPALQEVPLEVLIGPARVIEWTAGGVVQPAAFDGLPRSATRVLVKTRNSLDSWWEQPFHDDYVHLSIDAAQALVDRGIRLAGIDYLSIGEFGSGAETHQVLLGAGMALLEGLDLSAVAPGDYQLVCLPLRLASPDGAPARAVLIEEA